MKKFPGEKLKIFNPSRSGSSQADDQISPPFCPDIESGHGRIVEREIRVAAFEPTTCGFSGARSLIWERRRDIRKDDPKWEDRYFVSDQSPDTASAQWFYQKIRAHWGIESRLHWRKDAILNEDRTRCRNRKVISNLMLLRNLVIHFYDHSHEQNERMPAWVFKNQRDTRTLCRRMLRVQWSK